MWWVGWGLRSLLVIKIMKFWPNHLIHLQLIPKVLSKQSNFAEKRSRYGQEITRKLIKDDGKYRRSSFQSAPQNIISKSRDRQTLGESWRFLLFRLPERFVETGDEWKDNDCGVIQRATGGEFVKKRLEKQTKRSWHGEQKDTRKHSTIVFEGVLSLIVS